MNSKLQYNQNIISTFSKAYSIDSNHTIMSSDIHYFRYTCFKYNYFIKHIDIPKIPRQSIYETVLIEFREFPHLEFLIRNCIIKLGSKWAHTVICGNLNYKTIVSICNSISQNINIIKVNIDNLSPSEYNKFLTSTSFWNMLFGEKILIYQEDSIIFHEDITPFLKYDYIGAPFPIYQNDTPNSVGNGGFSLRSKNVMIKVLNTISIQKTVFNSCTLTYMDNMNLKFPPEDVYFSKNIQELALGTVADYDTASLFSSETIFNENSLGGHKFWLSNSNWKKQLSSAFKYAVYKPTSDLDSYLNYLNLDATYNQNYANKNAFDVDLYFCNYVNKLSMESPIDIIKYIQLIGLHGHIYHPKQITNIFPNSKIYTFLNDLFIVHKLNVYKVNDFVNKYLYNTTYEKLTKLLIKNRYYNLNEKVPLLLLVFIGNEERGNDLINRIINYKKIQLVFNVAFCFNLNKNIAEKLKHKIKNNFEFYAVYECKECGTDITPTMLMYDDITKLNKFQHVIKLQTKSITKDYTELTDYLLSVPLETLITFKNKNCNCIGHPNYYIKVNKDIFNNELKLRNLSKLNIDFSFVGGTIFYSPASILDKTLEFMQSSYRSYLLNNLYENNSINLHNSPIHFLERVYGTIKY
uniref:DUF5672 domain-containing protein n=1 Tax=viral metagenome TaxID=1070528 RepID=A0A6C0E0V2_9ZZZZ